MDSGQELSSHETFLTKNNLAVNSKLKVIEMRKGRLREQSKFCLVIWLIGNGSNEIGPSNSGIVLSITLLDSLGSRKGLISF